MKNRTLTPSKDKEELLNLVKELEKDMERVEAEKFINNVELNCLFKLGMDEFLVNSYLERMKNK